MLNIAAIQKHLMGTALLTTKVAGKHTPVIYSTYYSWPLT